MKPRSLCWWGGKCSISSAENVIAYPIDTKKGFEEMISPSINDPHKIQISEGDSFSLSATRRALEFVRKWLQGLML